MSNEIEQKDIDAVAAELRKVGTLEQKGQVTLLSVKKVDTRAIYSSILGVPPETLQQVKNAQSAFSAAAFTVASELLQDEIKKAGPANSKEKIAEVRCLGEGGNTSNKVFAHSVTRNPTTQETNIVHGRTGFHMTQEHCYPQAIKDRVRQQITELMNASE